MSKKHKGNPEISQYAHLGGQKIVKKYGTQYMSELGKKAMNKRWKKLSTKS